MNATARDLFIACAHEDEDGGIGQLGALIERLYGVAPGTAIQRARTIVESWQSAGLTSEDSKQVSASAEDWLIRLPPARSCTAGQWILTLATYRFGFSVENAALAREVLRLCPGVCGTDEQQPIHHLQLHGDAGHWRLTLNGGTVHGGNGAGDAAIHILELLIDLACRSEERLLVLHGAGLFKPDGKGLLLVAPGGSGKTTLATALNATGFGLLSDDVVPVDMEGRLLSLGTPVCLKSGSWEAVSNWRPEVRVAPVILRHGQPVRFLKPIGTVPQGTVKPEILIFPRYRPDGPSAWRSATPEEALQRIIEAEAVIRSLTEAKLHALAAWISAIPAFVIEYPDLVAGMALVRSLTERESVP